MAGHAKPTRPGRGPQTALYHGPMRRRDLVAGPTFRWAGGSRWGRLAAWLLRSAIIVVAVLAVYLAVLYLILPLLLDG